MSVSLRQTVMLCPLHATSYNKMLFIGKALVKYDIHVVVFAFNQFVAERKQEIEEAGIEYVCVSEYLNSNKTAQSSCQGVSQDVEQVIKAVDFRYKIKKMIMSLINCIDIFKRLKEALYYKRLQVNLLRQSKLKEREVNQVFDRFKPSVLLVAGDRHLGYEAAVIKKAKQLGVPVMIPPISVFSDPVDIANERNDRYSARQLKNFYVDRNLRFRNKWSRQCFQNSQGEWVSFYPFWMVEPLSKMGWLPDNPWVMGASNADLIMLSGKYEADRLKSNGLREDVIAVTGDPEFDVLYKNKKDHVKYQKELKRKYEIDDGQKIIILALPQYYEHKMLDYDAHWREINFLCAQLEQSGAHILLSLHPKMQLKNYKHLESDYKLRIVSEPLRDVMVIGDLFIAEQASSTWIWAVLCEIPAVLFGWVGTANIVDADIGVSIINQADKFSQSVKKLIDDSEHYSDSVTRQSKMADAIGLFDGKAMDRIASLILGKN